MSKTTTKPQSTTEPKEPRLLPCPLLGHLPDKSEFTAGPYIAVSGAPDMPKFYAVVCPGCCSTAYDEDKERVIKKWNTRARVPASVAPTADELDRIQKALDSASGERYQSLREWEQLAARWKNEGDMYGWNFHQGMMAGANYVDIYYHRVTREIKAIRDVAASTVAPVEQLDDAEDREWEHQSAISAIAYQFMKLFRFTTKDGKTLDELRPLFDAAREIVTRTFPVLCGTELAVPAPSAATAGICLWTFDAETDYWRSACGTSYFNEDDPATIHKGVLFCHHCGNRIATDTDR